MKTAEETIIEIAVKNGEELPVHAVLLPVAIDAMQTYAAQFQQEWIDVKRNISINMLKNAKLINLSNTEIEAILKVIEDCIPTPPNNL